MIKPFKNGWPVTQRFGENPDIYSQFGMKGHNGIDYATPTGTEIISPIKGTVIEAVRTYTAGTGYGKYIKIENDTEGILLAHLSRVDVNPGDNLEAGAVIGLSGNTGFSTGPHLHWGYYTKPRDRGNGYDGYIDQEQAVNKTVTLEAPVFEELVSKATSYDAFKNAGYDNYSAISSRMAEYQNELDGANSQIRSYQDFQKQIAIILNIPNQPTDIIGEVTKLVGVEDTLVEYQDKLEQQIKATNDVREQYKVIENEKVQALEAVKTAETATQARENDIEGLKKEIDTYQSDLNTCQVKLQNLVEQGVGKLTRTIKCGNYIIQIFKKK